MNALRCSSSALPRIYRSICLTPKSLTSTMRTLHSMPMHSVSMLIRNDTRPYLCSLNARRSSSSSDSNAKAGGQSNKADAESDSKEIVLTPGETVVAASRLTMWAGIAVFAAACAYYIIMELIPT
jgi:hypothetical protein